VDGTPLSEGADDPRIGTILGGEFRLDGVAGQGTSGTVYRAWQATMERVVAVKVLHADLVWSTPEVIGRMNREARAVARLSHPNIVTIFTAGTTPDAVPFLVMEHVQGESLEQVLDGGAVAEKRALHIAGQVVAALADTHAAGIVHRDLKPANVLLEQRRCATDFVKILDFGIAKLMPDADLSVGEESILTRDGTVCGTPHYIAPEQASGEAVDHRADIYSVGVMLYEMVTGQVPFDGSGMAVLLAHANRQAVPPHELSPSVGGALSAVIMRCLEKRPEQRYQSAEELADALDQIGRLRARGDTSAESTSIRDQPLAGPRRARSRAGLSISLLALLATGAAFASSRLAAERADREQAVTDVVTLARSPGVAPRGAAPVQMAGNSGADRSPARDELPAQRVVVVSEGGYSLRVLMPERTLVDIEYEILLDVWDPDGEPLATAELIVTIDDPAGLSRGVAAKPTAEAGRYRFRRAFTAAGPHTIRVFPPSGGATIRVFYDVIAPGAGAVQSS